MSIDEENTETTSQTSDQDTDRSFFEEEKDALTPDDIVADFKQANERIIKENLTLRERQQRMIGIPESQYPEAMVLSCINSKVPVK